MKISQTSQIIWGTAFVVVVIAAFIVFLCPEIFSSDQPPQVIQDDAATMMSVEMIGDLNPVNNLVVPLKNTEGKSFILTGRVWLNGNPAVGGPAGNAPDGFSLFIRQKDVTHRYELNSSFTRAKRRLLDDQMLPDIAYVANYPPAPLHEWVHFSLVVKGNKITYQFGNNTTVLNNLNTDGNNEINLIAGTKLSNVKLAIVKDLKPD